jgi:putative photosynthetic complex assembly protein
MATGFIGARDTSGERRAPSGEAPIISARLVGLMGFLCLSALLLAAFGRWTGVGVQQVPRAPVVEQRNLVFSDAGGGVILIKDADGGELVQRIPANEGSFVRTVMRGFAHDRLARGGDSLTPFHLTLRANGHLMLADPVTGREVILDPFGKPARDAFGPLLKSGGPAAPARSTMKAAGAVRKEGNTQ